LVLTIWYRFHELTLAVHQDWPETGARLGPVLQDLSWVRTRAQVHAPSLGLRLHRCDEGLYVPPMGREVFHAEGFSGLECGDDFYLTDGASCLHLQMWRGWGEVWLSHSFGEKPALLQSTFWAFGLLKLLRPLGFYSLHTAGLIAPTGLGLLIVGESGSGKSTLALGMIRQGWGYLSDDAVLLRQGHEGVEALALRKQVYIDADAAAQYADLPLGEEVPDRAGRWRRRVRVEEAYPSQHLSRSLPRLLLWSHIVPQTRSGLRPLDRLSALQRLLTQSGPQLFDRSTMAAHLKILKGLLQQTTTYELQAGLDLYHDPLTLMHLLQEVDHGEGRWSPRRLVSSS
jgi:hypothetical protein